ncbi:hypothetical protein J4454_00635 [Candidatus Pacearchaeota archaeon]|nr:hypothetical protein [Candidatus Pacearchaeota archaeon]
MRFRRYVPFKYFPPLHPPLPPYALPELKKGLNTSQDKARIILKGIKRSPKKRSKDQDIKK